MRLLGEEEQVSWVLPRLLQVGNLQSDHSSIVARVYMCVSGAVESPAELFYAPDVSMPCYGGDCVTEFGFLTPGPSACPPVHRATSIELEWDACLRLNCCIDHGKGTAPFNSFTETLAARRAFG